MTPLVCFVVGTRPEAIKIAPIVTAMRADGRCAPSILATGQHPTLVADVLNTFGLIADRTIALQRVTGSLAELAALLTTDIDAELATLDPSVVVVQGDTATAMVGSLVAFWRQIPTVHVEAGLRSGDLAAPFPEEANRRIVDHIGALHLAPTEAAAANLAAEGIAGDSVLVTGNTVVDAVRQVAAMDLPFCEPRLEPLLASERRLVLVTVHRRESWGEPLRRVLAAIRWIVAKHPDIEVILPAHPNPDVRFDVETVLGGEARVLVCDPLNYADLARVLARSTLVISDSGGIQEEAPSFGVPVLVTREVTERVEAVAAGCAKLVGTDLALIQSEADRILTDPHARAAMVASGNPFGDGRAAERTVAAIAWFLGQGARPTPFLAPVSKEPELALVGSPSSPTVM